MKTRLIKLSVVIILSLWGCESNKQVNITVYDQETKHPVDSVHIVIKAGKNGDYNKSGAEGYTNSDGKFNTSFMIGCSFGCYGVFACFQKEGYALLTEFNPKDTLIIYLKPQK